MGELPRFARETIYSGGPSERTLCVVGDVDCDGVPEVMIGARNPRGELYWVDRAADGKPDIIVGELGDPNGNHEWPPTLRVLHDIGHGLQEAIIDRGVSVHEAKAIELEGRIGIVGKPYQNLGAADAPRAGKADKVFLWLPCG